MPQPKGSVPWNKGKTGCQTAWNKGRFVPHLAGKNNARWNGGRWQQSDGYVMVYAPQHPNRAKGRNHVFEHILIMEKHLGRYLTQNEIVHHRNGNRADNRSENLELMSRAEHLREHCPRALKGKWSHQFGDSCLRCHTFTKPHYSRGLCRRCYAHQYRPSRALGHPLSDGKIAVTVEELP